MTAEGILFDTGADGQPGANQDLSDKSAASVKKSLTAKGAAADRLESKRYGSWAPAASNDTPEGKQTNRRVEFNPLIRMVLALAASSLKAERTPP